MGEYLKLFAEKQHRQKKKNGKPDTEEDEDEAEDEEWGGYHRLDPRVHLQP